MPAFCFPLSTQDPSFSLLLHDKLQVPNSSRRAWNEHDSRCDVCSTHLTQLKQEAVRMVLTLDQWDLSPTSSPPSTIGQSQGAPALGGASGAPGGPGSRDWPPPFLPSSSSSAAGPHPPQQLFPSPSPSSGQTPVPSPSNGPSNSGHGSPSAGQTSSCGSSNPQPLGHRTGSKPSSLGLGGGADRRNGSPNSGKAAAAQQQQPVTGVNSPSSNNGGGAAVQAYQHGNRTNGGVTLYPYQVSSLHRYTNVTVLTS